MPYAHVFVDGNSPFFHGKMPCLDEVHRLGGLVGVGRAWRQDPKSIGKPVGKPWFIMISWDLLWLY
jgi:hypothetical protein